MRFKDQMRKCATCGSISTEDKTVCGVCGRSLFTTASISLEDSSSVRVRLPQSRGRINRTAIVGIFSGLIIMALGAVEFVLARGAMLLLAPVLFGLGFLLVKSGVNTVTGTPFRPTYRRGWSIRPSGPGSAYLDREADMEEKKDEDLETGVAD